MSVEASLNFRIKKTANTNTIVAAPKKKKTALSLVLVLELYVFEMTRKVKIYVFGVNLFMLQPKPVNVYCHRTWPQTRCCPFAMKSHAKGSNCVR